MRFYDYTAIACLILFISIFTARTVFLSGKGRKIYVIGEGKKGVELFLEMLFLVFFPIWFAAILFQALKGEIIFLPEFLGFQLWNNSVSYGAAIFLLLLSILIFSYALFSFRDSWRIGIDVRNPGGLVTSGAFSLSRNPVFLSMYLFFTGIFLLYPNLFFLFFTSGAVAGIHIQILNEEKFLREYYGKAYIDYSERVGRYF